MDYNDDVQNGQRKINGQLCRVDWKLVNALRVIYDILAASRPPVSSELLASLKQAIDDADHTSSKVAEIKPPGCDPEKREDPTYTPPPTSG
jgi:hypothetical protein